MFKTLLFLISLSFTIAAQAQALPKASDNLSVSLDDYIDFIPISPVPIYSKFTAINSKNQISEQSLLEMSIDKKSILNLLPNEGLKTTIQQFNDDGSVNYIYSGLTVKKGNYRVTIDYNKYVIESIKEDSINLCLGYAKIGVGLRIIADLNTTKKNIDISSLTALGNAASKGEVAGSFSYQIIGIESKEITSIIPINAELTSAVSQIYLQTIAVVRGKIYDLETRIHPQAIAIKHSKCDLETLTKNLIGQKKTTE